MNIEDFIYEAICCKWSDRDIEFALSGIGVKKNSIPDLINKVRERVIVGMPANGSPRQSLKWLLDAFTSYQISERMAFFEFLKKKYEKNF